MVKYQMLNIESLLYGENILSKLYLTELGKTGT